jgi:hypothetical protein
MMSMEEGGEPAGLGAARSPPLPGARRELEALRRELSGRDLTSLTGTAAGEGAVRRRPGERSRVHLATHGLVEDEPAAL